MIAWTQVFDIVTGTTQKGRLAASRFLPLRRQLPCSGAAPGALPAVPFGSPSRAAPSSFVVGNVPCSSVPFGFAPRAPSSGLADFGQGQQVPFGSSSPSGEVKGRAVRIAPPAMTSPEAGFSLFEVLIAMMVLAVGVLGIVALQFKGLQFNQDAYIRTQINMLSYDLADRMRLNAEDADGYVSDLGSWTVPNTARGACTIRTASNSSEDVKCWKNDAQVALPPRQHCEFGRQQSLHAHPHLDRPRGHQPQLGLHLPPVSSPVNPPVSSPVNPPVNPPVSWSPANRPSFRVALQPPPRARLQRRVLDAAPFTPLLDRRRELLRSWPLWPCLGDAFGHNRVPAPCRRAPRRAAQLLGRFWGQVSDQIFGHAQQHEQQQSSPRPLAGSAAFGRPLKGAFGGKK